MFCSQSTLILSIFFISSELGISLGMPHRVSQHKAIKWHQIQKRLDNKMVLILAPICIICFPAIKKQGSKEAKFPYCTFGFLKAI